MKLKDPLSTTNCPILWPSRISTTSVVKFSSREFCIDENVDASLSSNVPEVLRLLGAEGSYGEMLELAPDWAYQIIKQIGNYSESYEANVGPDTPLEIARGLNALWTQGGILYAPPFR